MPDWAFWLLLIVFGLGALRWIAEALVGKEAADHAVGNLLSDAVKGLLFLPFRAGPAGRMVLLALLGAGAYFALRLGWHL